MIIKLLILTIIVCYIVDLSGFIDSVKNAISKYILKIKCTPDQLSLKPFDCSLCLTFWTLLTFTIVNSAFTFVNLLIIVLLSFFSSNISAFLQYLKDLAASVQNKLNQLL